MNDPGKTDPSRPEEQPVTKETGPDGGGSRRGYLVAAAVVFAIATFLLGYLLAPRGAVHSTATSEAGQPQSDKKILHWTCSMHPQIKMSGPGRCPICGMKLVPLYESGGDAPKEGLELSKTARELAEIATSPVEYRPMSVTVRMVGKIEFDETGLAQVSAYIGGRIDKLYVNYVGIRAAKGDHLAYIYSPELRTAQEEYLIALRRWQAASKAGNAEETASSAAIREAVRKKLELWGILPVQIEELEQSGRIDDHMTIYAPVGGTVISRDAFEGKYVQAGERLFTIADLSSVWAVLDAYEIDLAWLRYGQKVEFEAEAFPGEKFFGRVSFIQPVLNEMTRTVKVRADIPNPGERLRPGMFVRARVDVALNEAGEVKEPDLAGRWICPMHPNVIKDSAGTCDICSMNLVGAATLGFGKPELPAKMVLSIPATAPLITGRRAVVYVEEPYGEELHYVPRQIELGPRTGDYYIVRSGLEKGEKVVTRGNFKIDASLQIVGKPSMMKPEGGGAPTEHHHDGTTGATSRWPGAQK